MAKSKELTRVWTALAAGGGVAAIVSLLHATGLLMPLELKTRDMRMKWTVPKPGGNPNIVMVYVTDHSLRTYRTNPKAPTGWPWPRDREGYLFSGLTRGGCRLALFDFLRNDPDPQGLDEALADAFKKNGNVYLAAAFNPEVAESYAQAKHLEKFAIEVDSDGSVTPPENVGVEFPIPTLADAIKGIGDAGGLVDPDKVQRRYGLFSKYQGRFYPSFTLAALMDLKGVRSIQVRNRRVTVGDLQIPVDRQGAILLRYYEPYGTFPWLDAIQVINPEFILEEEKKPVAFDFNQFMGKIVVVGATAAGLYDLKATPLSGTYPGANIHATAIANLLNEDYLRAVPPFWSFALISFLAIATAFVTRYVSALAGPPAAILIAASYAGASIYLFHHRWVVDLFPQLVAVVLAYAGASTINFLFEGRQKARVKRTFQQYVSARVVDKILKNPDELKMEGERKNLTIFFMDFAGFTTLSETLDPVELVKLLNQYHNTAVEEIFRTEGTLDKFIGDAIMAFWGDPIDQPDHATRACRAAISVQNKLKALAETLRWHGLPDIKARIGMNSGPAVAGNMGSREQYNYTVIGSDVNLASRLEGVNKEFGTEIIISDSTYQPAKDVVEVRMLGSIQVKGQTKGVRIYELMGEKGQVDPARVVAARSFEKGLGHFWDRRWAEARTSFSQADGVAAKVYRELCEEYEKNPPPPDWDGTYVMTHK